MTALFLAIPVALVLLVLGLLTSSLNKPVPRWAWMFIGGLALVLVVLALL